MSREFEKDMEEYLRARRRAGFNIKEILKNLFPKKQPDHINLPEEVEVYHEAPPQSKKDGMLTKFFKKEEQPNEDTLRAHMQADDAIADLKEISKITLNMIRKLPDEQLKEFRQSTDFEKMKSILKKHDLIK